MINLESEVAPSTPIVQSTMTRPLKPVAFAARGNTGGNRRSTADTGSRVAVNRRRPKTVSSVGTSILL